MKKLLLTVSLALSITACGKKSNDEVAGKVVSMMEEVGTAVESSGGDCAKMGTAVEGVLKKYDVKGLKAAAEKMKGDKAEGEKMMKKYGDRIQKAMPKMMGMAACKDVSEKFKDLM